MVLAKKSLGQHWLNDDLALESMAGAAEITKNDTVLEIGPGLGALTKLLVKVAGRVVAVEFDPELAKNLSSLIKADNLTVIEQDILRFDFSALPPDFKIAANIPYYLTSHLVRILSELTNRPLITVLLVQKEVAERLAAHPGALSILGVSAQYYNIVSLGPVVPKGSFEPVPKVDSQIVILRRRSEPIFGSIIDSSLFFRIVKAGFSQRRKTIENSLAGGLQLTKEASRELLAEASIPNTVRAQALSLDQWHMLYKAYCQL